MSKKKPDAFTDKHVLNGTTLRAWTPARVIAGQSMGMLYPEIGKKGYDQYRRTKTYAGIVKDVAICLWLCSVDEERVDEADGSPGEAYAEARAWAAKLEIHKMSSEKWDQAFAKFAGIVSEVDQSLTIPKSEPEEDDSGNE